MMIELGTDLVSDVVRSLVISFVRSAASGWVRDLGSRVTVG